MRQEDGYTPIELVFAMSLVVILLLVPAPGPSSANVASNETAAIAALRSIASAQDQFVASGAVDSGCDRVGEYGYLGELAGTAWLRACDIATGLPVLEPNGLVLSPPLLPAAFGHTRLEGGESEVTHRGYRFKMYLPDVVVGANIVGVPETGANGAGGATPGNFPDPENCEVFWVCCAWPDEAGSTGNRAFFINQEGVLLQTANLAGARNTALFYDGPGGGPTYDAALDRLRDPGPGAITGMADPLGSPHRKANDGNLWTSVRPD